MPHMLGMAAFQLRDPVTFVILPERDNPSIGHWAVHDAVILSVESWVTL